MFNKGESNSINISDNLPSLGSNTVRSATAPAPNPLKDVLIKLPERPAPFKNLAGPAKPVTNLDTPSVIFPANVSGL